MLIFPLILLSSITSLIFPQEISPYNSPQPGLPSHGLPSGLVNLLRIPTSEIRNYISFTKTLTNCRPNKVMNKIERFSSLIEYQVSLLLNILGVKNDISPAYDISTCRVMKDMVKTKYDLKATWMRLNKILMLTDQDFVHGSTKVVRRNRIDDTLDHSDSTHPPS